MSRYYVCGKVNTSTMKGVLVCDKEDGIVEFVTYKQVQEYINAGISIDGFNLDSSLVTIMHDKVKKKELYRQSVKELLGGSREFIREPIISFVIVVPDDARVGYCDSKDIFEIQYMIERYVEPEKLPVLMLSCYCIDSVGCVTQDEEILFGNNNEFPLVDEFWWKLNNCDSKDLKDIIIKYFGGVKNIVRISTSVGAYYLACEEEYDEMLNSFTNVNLVEENFIREGI